MLCFDIQNVLATKPRVIAIDKRDRIESNGVIFFLTKSTVKLGATMHNAETKLTPKFC